MSVVVQPVCWFDQSGEASLLVWPKWGGQSAGLAKVGRPVCWCWGWNLTTVTGKEKKTESGRDGVVEDDIRERWAALGRETIDDEGLRKHVDGLVECVGGWVSGWVSWWLE